MIIATLLFTSYGFMFDITASQLCFQKSGSPVDMVNLPLFIGFCTSQVVVVWDFFHQRWPSERGRQSCSRKPSKGRFGGVVFGWGRYLDGGGIHHLQKVV